MSTTDNSDIISLNLRFRNSQNRNVIFVIEVSKNDLVSVIADRVRGILAPHLPVRPHNFHLQQIYPTSIQRRRMQPENMISVYFPENPDEDMIHIFVYLTSLISSRVNSLPFPRIIISISCNSGVFAIFM